MLNIEKRHEKEGRLSRKVDALEQSIIAMEGALRRDEALLDMYEDPLWEKFVEKVLLPEKTRLAERRMAIPIERKDDHLLINGQYLQAEALAMGRDALVSHINTTLTELEDARAKLERARAERSRTAA